MGVRICFRITMTGDDGKPEQHGMCFELKHVKEGVTAEQLAACLDKQGLIDVVGLTGHVTPEQMELITPEQFDAEFSDEDMVDIDA